MMNSINFIVLGWENISSLVLGFVVTMVTSEYLKVQQTQCDVSPTQKLSLKIKITAHYFKMFFLLLVKSNSLYLISPWMNQTLCLFLLDRKVLYYVSKFLRVIFDFGQVKWMYLLLFLFSYAWGAVPSSI